MFSIHQFNVRHHLLHLLVDPVLLAALPVAELLGLEPEGDLLVGGLHSVGAVADVTTNLNNTIANEQCTLEKCTSGGRPTICTN